MTATIRKARAELAKVIETAAAGQEVIITSNGIPRAKLVGLTAGNAKPLDMGKLRQLARQGATRNSDSVDSTRIIGRGREDR